MLTFRKLTISDQKTIDDLFIKAPYLNNYHASELVSFNLLAWNYHADNEIALIEGIVILRSLDKRGYVYLPPLADSKEKFKRGIEIIHDYDPHAFILGISEEMLSLVDIPHTLSLYDDDYAEYIYDPRNFIELKGNKLYRKRNLWHQFEKKYNYELIDYQAGLQEEVLSFLHRYTNEGGADDDLPAICYALDHLKELSLFADLLYANQTLVAISIGGISKRNYGVVLFEKADYNYIGSFVAIAKLSYEKRYKDLEIITRQEDMGITELRAAKLSWHPIEKEKKYALVFSQKIRDYYELYASSFSDSFAYRDYIFLYDAREHNIISVERNQKIVSGLILIDRTMHYNGQNWPLSLIVGMATNPAYRRQGLLKEVVKKAIKEAINLNHAFIFLYPVDSHYYTSSGFINYILEAPLDINWPHVEVTLEAAVVPELLADIYQEAIKGREGYMDRSLKRWSYFMNSLAQDGTSFDLIKHEKEVYGYLAHSGEEADEAILLKPIFPVNSHFDFSKLKIPSFGGDATGQMIRITSVLLFLANYRPSAEMISTFTLRINDPLIAENNLTLEIGVNDYKLNWVISDKQPTLCLDIATLTKYAIGIVPNQQTPISLLFPKRDLICFDKF
ncbi:MAG TPA: GNAT family N-acetyltransferase [Bacilli bacterium]|nr:GNAT family N-acetyltransferase [Bacilli bacterium]